jgi:chlorobactene glucosyltransferase
MSLVEAFNLAVVGGLAALAAQVWLNRRVLQRLGAYLGEPKAGAPDASAAPGSASAAPRPLPAISVLIPARDEAAKIAACVRSWAAQEYPDFEILVYDDDSTDATAAIAASAGGERVRILRGGSLPPGWHGKPWACHRLRAEARGALLVFADADVTAAPRVLRATEAALTAQGADLLSALPRHTARRPLLRALAGLQSWTALAFVPLWLARLARRPTFAALNGQFLAMPAEVYDAFGGFAAVRGSVAEDVDLGRLLAARHIRALLVDASALLRCVPYGTLAAAWKCNTRNLVPIFFGSASLLLGATAALMVLYLAPVGMLAAGMVLALPAPQFLWLPLAEIALALLGRWLVDSRFGTAGLSTLLHAAAVAGLCAMSAGSVLQHRVRGAVDWRGRRYSVSTGGD